MKLLLFDIDGTLIRSHGAGRQALGLALEALFATSGPLADYQMSGKTDARIVTDLLTAIGLPPAEIPKKLPQVYALMAEKARTVFWENEMAVCPGVVPLLLALQAREDVLLGLLTGNSEGTAPLKLQAAGLEPALFRVGAFGSDDLDRNQLPAVAMARAAALNGNVYSGENTVVIGDTPADILCARAAGATAVAVASGWHSSSTLQKYQPDYLLDNMTDTGHVLDILLA